MVFEPALVKANVGDTIRVVPTDMSHNAETIPTILPASVALSVGGMNKEFVLAVTKPGLYGIKCKPHHAMGMVALVDAALRPLGLTSAVALRPQDGSAHLAIAILTFADTATREAALAVPAAGPVFADIPNFTDAAPVATMCDVV